MKLDIPHVSQPRNQRSCGAACLQMLFGAYGIVEPYSQTWSDVSLPDPKNPNNRHCYNGLILKKLLSVGFQACGVSVSDIHAALDVCALNNISVILNHRIKPYSSDGHYSVYLYTDYKGIHVNDPMKPAGNRVISLHELTSLMSAEPKSDEIVQKNTLILASKNVPPTPTKSINCAGAPIELFSLGKMDVLSLLCHHHGKSGHWVPM